MSCSELRLVAFLAGDLSEEEMRRFDQHLLECEGCWRAVQEDRSARLALERLREPAPPGLGERVSAAVGLAVAPRRSARRTPIATLRSGRRGVLVGVLAALLGLGGVFGWRLSLPGATDPPQLVAVMAMLPSAASNPPLREGEHLVIGGQALEVQSFVVGGMTTVVATSMRPFSMPARSHLLAGSSSRAWMATSGSVALYGVNHPAGTRSMFLVAKVPMAKVPELAALLHLV